MMFSLFVTTYFDIPFSLVRSVTFLYLVWCTYLFTIQSAQFTTPNIIKSNTTHTFYFMYEPSIKTNKCNA